MHRRNASLRKKLRTNKEISRKAEMEKSPTLFVSSPNVKYTDEFILSDYEYEETLVTKNGNEYKVRIIIRYVYNL